MLKKHAIRSLAIAAVAVVLGTAADGVLAGRGAVTTVAPVAVTTVLNPFTLTAVPVAAPAVVVATPVLVSATPAASSGYAPTPTRGGTTTTPPLTVPPVVVIFGGGSPPPPTMPIYH